MPYSTAIARRHRASRDCSRISRVSEPPLCGIRNLKDLEGERFTSPAGAATHRLCPLFARLNGIDASKVDVLNIAPNVQKIMLVQDQVQGGFGFSRALDEKILLRNLYE
jgi:ABC-type nitrate/sulfonate/bicarbonate transport system substrate-binding protein